MIGNIIPFAIPVSDPDDVPPPEAGSVLRVPLQYPPICDPFMILESARVIPFRRQARKPADPKKPEGTRRNGE